MNRTSQPRGYVLMVVVVLGVVLASLGAILLYATGRDRAEARQQSSSIRSVYAAESAVAVGIEHLRELLEEKSAPDVNDLNDVEARTVATLGTSLSSATFPVLSVKYYDPVLNTVSDTPLASANSLQTITEGINKGLKAQQTPIQVLATARIDNASSSVADAIRVDLIPIFQFAIFFDGDLETLTPTTMSVQGRVHTNGNLYLSNGASSAVTFADTVTVAGRVHSHSAASTSVKVGTGANSTTFRRLSDGTQVRLADDLPRSDADQKTYLQSTYGIQGGLQDSTTGAEPLSIPLRLSSSASCTTTASCGVGRSCVKVRTSDLTGVCTNNVVSRPDTCAASGNKAEFAQSLAVELIRRPQPDYATTGVNAPYLTGFASRDDVALTSPYAADFGPRPAQVEDDGAARAVAAGVVSGADPDDILELDIARRTPVLTSTTANDDPGAIVDRLYWKAHIRIIDGVWYRSGTSTPIFNPEVNAPGTANPDPTTDLDHAFARVLRYSWWWDARENRVYCEGAAGTNCVTDGNEYQRGAQIRAADFDMAAFMALLERSDARTRLFAGGTVPANGVIIYMSETYDPRYDDANSGISRAANVRNFLNFPVTHNHLVAANINGTTPHTSLTGLTRRVPATAYTEAVPATPHELGWFPENLWGQNVAALRYESMTRPTSTAADVPNFYANPPTAGSKNSSTCAVPGTDFAASRRPASRPTTFATARVVPTCIQVGAQPIGPENAVRVVRAHTVPAEGLTFVTDNRLYVHGDVNVRTDSTVVSGTFATSQDIGGKVAFMADSLTVLSERFDDRTHQATATGGPGHFNGFHLDPTTYALTAWSKTGLTAARALPYAVAASSAGEPPNLCATSPQTAIETRINASLLMGDVPACLATADDLGNKSGGVNNFPRFIERWESGSTGTGTGVDLMINGSMVGLFRSERGNSRFLAATLDNTGVMRATRSGDPWASTAGVNSCDYRPPNRKWTFDVALLAGIDKLPPGTPRVVATDRLRWVRR